VQKQRSFPDGVEGPIKNRYGQLFLRQEPVSSDAPRKMYLQIN